MDWLKLIGLAGVLFMLLEVLSAKLAKLKPWLLRVIVFVVMTGASLGLGIIAPVVVGIKAQVVLNAILYVVVESSLFLFRRNELNLSLKNFILARFSGGTPTNTTSTAPRIEERR